MADLSNVRVNGARLWDSLMEMARIGATPKGGSKLMHAVLEKAEIVS